MDPVVFSVIQVVLLVALLVAAVVLLLRSGKSSQADVLAAVEQGFRRVRDEATSQSAALRKELADGLARGEQGRELRFANFEQIVSSRVKELAAEQQRLIATTSERLDTLGERSGEQAEKLRSSLQSSFAETNKSLLENHREHRASTDLALQKVVDGENNLREDIQRELKSVIEGEVKLREAISKDLKELRQDNEGQIARMRDGVSKSINELQEGNEKKLEQMRRVVEEKLESTLEKRLGQSFKIVGDQLEAVQKGLGEMQSLASGVGDLKKVLTNVKTRGTWGEVQLGSILEQLLTAEQYAQNVRTIPESGDSVEYAIRLPGQVTGKPVWLPIDSKFPMEDYQRLVDASQAGDQAAVDASVKALQRGIQAEAKKIRDKYVAPPHTTDFAIMFLPTEGLYAEALRAPGLADSIQRDYRVVIAGPTTLTALVNSLRIGFKTLAIQERSSEVWQVLGGVKTEFEKFGAVLAKIKKQLGTVQNTIESSERRTRAMERKLRSVEELPADLAQEVLELRSLAPPADDEDDDA